jgi:hypothetical protein
VKERSWLKGPCHGFHVDTQPFFALMSVSAIASGALRTLYLRDWVKRASESYCGAGQTWRNGECRVPILQCLV